MRMTSSVGFEHRADAERFLTELRERFTKFGLELHSETRLLEFGPFAAENRRGAGQAKPETFDFLGFTHICGKKQNGRFTVGEADDPEEGAGKAQRGESRVTAATARSDP